MPRNDSSRYRNMTVRLRSHKTLGLVEAIGIRMQRQESSKTSSFVPQEHHELDRIAYQLFRTPFLWWSIADQNDGMAWPLDIPKGTPIAVPPSRGAGDLG